MSSIANKAKDAIVGRDDTAPTTTGARETHIAIDPDTGTTTGPHRSDMANRADRMFSQF